MAKLPKALSSIRARSTSLANRTQDWQHRTTERSGSKIISAMMDSGPREPNTLDEARTKIIAKIKRETKRISKMKAFGEVPSGRETPDSRDRTARILRKEAIVNGLYFNLQELNAQKVRIDKKELHKFQNNPKSGEFVGQGEDFVRLEKGKIVPKIQTYLAGNPNKHGPSKINKAKKPLEIEKYFPKHAAKVKSLAQLVREEKLKRKTFAPEIQAKIEEVFGPDTISEDDFEKMMNGDN